jgi:glycogen operon protein
VFRQRAFFVGEPVGDAGLKDLTWFTPSGTEMSEEDWFSPACMTIGMYLAGDAIRTRDAQGERITDDSFLLVLHAGGDVGQFCLPGQPWATSYDVVLDTATNDPAGDPAGQGDGSAHRPGETLKLTARTVVLLRAQR